MPPSTLNSEKASSHSEAENLSPKVMRECLKASASIWPLISKASKDLRMVSSSSVPPAILPANRVTIWVKFMGPWASSEPMDLPWLPKAVTRSEAEMRPSLSQSMMPKASLNCWMAEWEKESKMLAFLGMVKLVGLTAGS